MLCTNSLLSIDINYSFERRECLNLIILCTSLYSKNRGDFAANTLQEIQTILLKLMLPSRIQWRWLLPVNKYFTGNCLCSLFSVLECCTFYWKRLNYLLKINYPANVAFFCLVCKLRSDSGFHECICYSEVFYSKMKYFALQTVYLLFVVQDQSPP